MWALSVIHRTARVMGLPEFEVLQEMCVVQPLHGETLFEDKAMWFKNKVNRRKTGFQLRFLYLRNSIC